MTKCCNRAYSGSLGQKTNSEFGPLLSLIFTFLASTIVTVDEDIIVNKIKYLKFCNNSLNWLKSVTILRIIV